MAKKKKKKPETKRAPKPKKRKPIDSAGWGFFLVASLILVGPGIYIGYISRSDAADPGAPVVLGIFCALGVAGVITWIANMILQTVAARRREQAKEKRG